MNGSLVSELEKALIIAFGQLALTKRVDAMLSFALLTYNLGRELKDEKLETLARSWLSLASEDWLKQSGDSTEDASKSTCSFCGADISAGNGRRAIAGPKVFICRDCVGLCIEIMANEAPEWLDDKIAAVKKAPEKS